ncbi:MAG: SDR family oxidoreductase [Candidatus Dojkabacteria bacterium]|nr:SDR family oxidoreductase [Candidatus Dojkabacteria bacterium]MDQ7020652.1 SDR family oxidoreductase [Candidatus Dojkabacteria bacterium]
MNKKTVLITGVSRGIGKATAVKFLEEGWNVIGTYFNSEENAKELTKLYPDIKTYKCDSRDEKSIKLLIESLPKLDLLINNAGIFRGERVSEMNYLDWKEVIDINLNGMFLMTKYSLPLLRKSEKPVIINISSRVANDSLLGAGYIAYSVSKSAVNTFSKALNIEEEKIKVASFNPEITDTDIFRKTFTKDEQEEVIESNSLRTTSETANEIYDLYKSMLLRI